MLFPKCQLSNVNCQMSTVCGLIDSKAITDINELTFNILLILRSLTPTCPEDRSPISKRDLKSPSDQLINRINNLNVKCDYSTNGCSCCSVESVENTFKTMPI